MAGIALIDVSGHRITDALLAAMLHQAFLLGAIYELDMFGTITRRLFENLNTRFYQSSGAHKFVSLIYGEISEDARFRFLSAAHPLPAVFSNEHDRFMDVEADRASRFRRSACCPSFDCHRPQRHRPARSDSRTTTRLNEWPLMGAGDILLLHTDGLAEHRRGDEDYFPAGSRTTIREVKHAGARRSTRRSWRTSSRSRRQPTTSASSSSNGNDDCRPIRANARQSSAWADTRPGHPSFVSVKKAPTFTENLRYAPSRREPVPPHGGPTLSACRDGETNRIPAVLFRVPNKHRRAGGVR